MVNQKGVVAQPIELPPSTRRDGPDSGVRSLRVALVHAGDEGGGAESAVVVLHRALRRLGHASELHVGRRNGSGEATFEISRPRIFPGLNRLSRWIGARSGVQGLYAPGFRRLAGQLAADVVHVHSLWGGAEYADLHGLVALSRRYPTVLTMHDAWLTTGHCACPMGCERWRTGCGRCPDLTLTPAVERDATRVNWRRKARALGKARVHVTTVSRWLKARAEESPLLAGKDIAVVHNGIDDLVFKPAPRASARRHLGISPHDFVVLLAGQTVEGVRSGIAMEGIHSVREVQAADLLALVVGRSAETAAERIRPRRVLALPFQSPAGLATCYRAADVTLISSTYETFGLIAAESLACGTPVIAFATGGLPEVVEEGHTGLLIEPGDASALTRALEWALAHRSELREMGDRAAASAALRFGSETIARRYLEVYESAISAFREGGRKGGARPESLPAG
jgi:glycosyltransferase involved in cell wall biosynthesis